MEPLLKPGIDPVYDKLEGIVTEGMTVFDVGSHQGAYTHRFLEETGETGMVICFEMNPDNITSLFHRYGSCDNVQIVHTAVSDQDGTEPYFQGADSWTCNVIGHNTSYEANRQVGTIPSMRLDTHYDGFVVDFMKIDVEGAEYKVLKGCKGIIKNIKRMLIECHFEDDWPEIRDLVFNQYRYVGKNLMTDEPVDAGTEARPYQLLLWRE